MKPARVLVLADIPGWAWDMKAQAYRTHLAKYPEFTITVGYSQKGVPDLAAFDLIHTFEVKQLDQIPPETRTPILSGLTAHVWRTWGEERMHAWASRVVGLHGNSLLLVKELHPFHERIYYTPNGVDPIFWHRYEPRPTSLVACHVGKPNPRKGADLIKEACRIANVPLLACQRTSAIRLPPVDIRALYQKASVQITMSDMDGTPNPMLESAACENLLVSTRIGNMPDVIVPGENGALVDRTIPDLVEVLLNLKACSRAEIAEMGVAARRTILDEWTWAKQVLYVRDAWNDALGRSR